MARLEVTADKFSAALLDLIQAAKAGDDEAAHEMMEAIVAGYVQLAALVELDLNKLAAPLN